jgi:hypothetical protein
LFEIKNVRCIHHTKNNDGEIKALRVTGSFFNMDRVWVPNFAVHDDSPVWRKGDEGTLIVTDEYADKQGWI